jgi:hypothetical protein
MRLATAAAGTLVLSLLASIVDARPIRRDHLRSQSTVCGAPAAVRSFAGRVAAQTFSRKGFFRTRQVVHRHIMATLQKNPLKRLADDDEAISPAVSGQSTLPLLGALEPIGMLAVPPCQPTSHRTICRRSPRGPPPVTA